MRWFRQWFRRWRARSVPATSPYRWQPMQPPTVPRRGAMLAVFAIATVIAPASCCFSMAINGLAMDGPGVRPPNGLTLLGMLAAFIAAVLAYLQYPAVRPRWYAVVVLALGALIASCMAGVSGYVVSAAYWDRGCARGEAGMCHDAAKARQYGIGVHRDPIEARRLRARACALGDPWSCLEALREDRAAAPPGACSGARELCASGGGGSACQEWNAQCPTVPPVLR